MIRRFLLAAPLLAAACGTALPEPQTRTIRNFLFITADDLGLQLSSYGETRIQTPHVDGLAAEGVRFEVAYTAQASCSPSRSAMFTGRYVHSTGQYGLTNTGFALHEHLHDQTLPAIFERHGFTTGIIGKLHVNPDDTFPFDVRHTNYAKAREPEWVAERAAEIFSAANEGGRALLPDGQLLRPTRLSPRSSPRRRTLFSASSRRISRRAH